MRADLEGATLVVAVSAVATSVAAGAGTSAVVDISAPDTSAGTVAGTAVTPGYYGGRGYGGRWYGGGWYPYYGWSGYPYGIDDYGYYDTPSAYNDDQSGLYAATNDDTVAAAQKELAKLGYYHGSIDGVIGPETAKAVRWFQSVDKLPVNGQLNDQTLRALDVS